jgi:hypothetical protein
MTTAKPKSKSKTIADFRAIHDKSVVIPNRITAALAKMAEEGPEQWEYEIEFGRRAGIGGQDLARFRETFTEHLATVRAAHGGVKYIWFATKAAAAKARQSLIEGN